MSCFDPAKTRAHRLSEAKAGFPLLRGCPNTEVMGLVDYLDGLVEADRIAFAAQLSDFAEAQSGKAVITLDDSRALQRTLPLIDPIFGEAATSRPPPERWFMPVRLYAGIRNQAQNKSINSRTRESLLSWLRQGRAPADGHAASLDELVPVAPKRLRMLIDDAITARFGSTGARLSPEHTVYSGYLPRGGFTVDVGFPRGRIRGYQFTYRFNADMADGRRVSRQSYESVWLRASHWDYLTKTNAERSILHLIRAIEACIELI